MPLYRRAGWPVQRVLTDGGSEFKATWPTPAALSASDDSRMLPRHAWTNRFTERLHGTIVHEHWRIEFGRQYFTSWHSMQSSLNGFMTFYNERQAASGLSPAVARQLSSSAVSRADLMTHSGTADVSTPFRVLPCQGEH